jgi:hypothetical protein
VWEGEAAFEPARAGIHSEHLETVRVLADRHSRGRTIHARIEEYLPAGSLRDRLAVGPLTVGEAVTVLLAVCDAVRAVHEAGYGGVGLRAERVRFRDDGCPVVTELGGVGPLTRERANADASRFLALSAEVAQAVEFGGGALLARVESALESGDQRLRESLLAEASPSAVRLVRAAERGGVETPEAAPGTLRGVARWDLVLDGDPIGAVRAALAGFLRSRRRAVLIVLLPAIAVVVAIGLIPSGTATPEEGIPSGDSDDRFAVGATATPSPTAPEDSREQPAEGAIGHEETADGDVLDLFGTGESAMSTAEDPAEAALALLASGGGAAHFAGARADVTQRWGEAALVRVEPDAERSPDSEPASLLLVRNEAGWRIRAVYP